MKIVGSIIGVVVSVVVLATGAFAQPPITAACIQQFPGSVFLQHRYACQTQVGVLQPGEVRTVVFTTAPDCVSKILVGPRVSSGPALEDAAPADVWAAHGGIAAGPVSTLGFVVGNSGPTAVEPYVGAMIVCTGPGTWLTE